LTAPRYLSLLGQLALVLLTARVFRIEAMGGFDRLLPLILAGFAVHALAPARVRLPLFVLISWGGLALVLGPGSAAFVIGAGLAIIGLIHLPAPFPLRVALVLAAAVPLGAARAGRLELPAAWAAALPVLASLFLFRMIVYAYDLRFGKAPASAWHRLAYFFLLPNACFPLFPVVDPKTFARTYYDDEPALIYQKGVRWMARGVLQLVLYRAVYYHVLPAPWEVEAFGDLVRFSLGSYLLYVRISGIFHLIVGTLCLFGFNLPETHHRFLFASSFTDFWRRINIYFTGFLAKVVYYPVFTRARPLGMTPALLLSVAAVFVATTLLHAWQWFWLRGSFLVTANDVVFFGVLGALVMITALREARSPRRRKRGARTFADHLRHAFAVTGVFAFLSFFWGMWSSPSVAEWAAMVAGAAPAPRQALQVVAALAAAAVAGASVRTLADRARDAWPGGAAALGSSPAAVAATCLLLLAMAQPPVRDRLGDRAGALVATLTEDRLSAQDEERVIHGYYEGLLESGRVASRAWEAEETDDDLLGPMNRSDGVERHPGLPAYTLKPSRATSFRKYVLHTNEWGMRDRSYTREKPAGALRIAVLGDSYAMGMGVADDEVFEGLLEARLEREQPLAGWPHYEVLNFAVGGYTVHDHLEILPRVLSFQPDVLVWVTTPKIRALSLGRLTEYLRQGRDRHSEVLREVLRLAGGAPDDPRKLRAVLERTEETTTGWALERIAEEARAAGCLPVAVLVPSVRARGPSPFQGRWSDLTAAAGFRTFLLDDVYGDATEEEIAIGEKNDHPTAYGHRLIADGIYGVLVGEGGVLRELPAP
jgi:D-alanyl-lipoteichoic acid acyltransferase DltB (MBOAT superfamily)